MVYRQYKNDLYCYVKNCPKKTKKQEIVKVEKDHLICAKNLLKWRHLEACSLHVSEKPTEAFRTL